MFSPCIKFISPHNNVSSTPSTSDMANSITKDFFTSPALSLSLAGVFRNGNEIEEVEVEAESRGRDETVDISSENTGPLGRSDEDGVGEGVGDEEEEEGEDVDNNKRKRKKRKTYHRHTAQQIREMEELFKDSPHPDEKQRQQLSKQLGLSPQQVKFWFQNRRTQIKAIQERHENSLLKSEMDKIREENRFLRENIKKTCCPNCGFSTMSKDIAIPSEEQKLRIENARLKAEIEKLRGRPGDFLEGTTSPSSSFMAGADQNKNKTSIDAPLGNFGIDKSSILERVNFALDELTKMATANEPLWVNSLESGRQILNYDEYLRAFAHEITRSSRQAKFSVEASRETGIVFLDMSRLIQAFMDVTQWKEMFCCMISKAAILDVISEGEGDTQSGLVQLIFAELQVLTPTVPTREIYFVRYLKQLNHDRWAIVDVTIDMTEDSIDATLVKFRKRPSGCIIEDKGDGHCEVIWVEHMECQKTAIPTMYRSIVNTGLAFGAHHWMETLGLHCERMVFSMATNIPTKDSLGVSTLAGRRSILRLAHRMCANFCHAIGASRNRTWTKVSTRSGDDIRFTSRKNINDLGEPQGAILCAVSSVWLPVSSVALFNFLRDESQRTQWDFMLSGGPTQTIVNLVKGKDRRNSVTVHAVKCTETSRMWVLQDSSTNAYESTVVYAPVGADEMQSVMTGCESTNVAILPSGFSILPDGLESRPLVITSRSNTEEDRAAEGGSLLTVAFQVLVSSSPATKVTQEAVENVNDIVSSTLDRIKRSLGCEDE